MSSQNTTVLKVFVFDHPEQDIPLFLELFSPNFREAPSLEDLYEQVQSYSFFDKKEPQYVIIDHIPKSIDWDLLKSADFSIYLFFTKTVKATPGVELFLFSQEKPWERQRRLHQWIDQYCQKNKRSLQKEAFERLYKICDGYGLAILRHMEQLVLTVNVPHITIQQLEEHHLYDVGPNDWEKAKLMLFSPRHTLQPDPLDILSFIPKLRQEIYYNLAMFESNPQIVIPPYRKKELQQKSSLREALGENYFLSILPILLEVELLAKSASCTQGMLFDVLYTKMLKVFLTHTDHV